jgi:hypothetical protein
MRVPYEDLPFKVQAALILTTGVRIGLTAVVLQESVAWQATPALCARGAANIVPANTSIVRPLFRSAPFRVILFIVMILVFDISPHLRVPNKH